MMPAVPVPAPPLPPDVLDRARPWQERALLIATLAAFAFATLWLTPEGWGIPLIAVLTWLLIAPLLALFEGARLLRDALVVSVACCPSWHASLLAVQARFAWPDRALPRLLVVQDPTLNASAWWWPGRPLLVVTSGLAAALAAPADEALRRAILGHELAHSRWHQPWTVWTGGPAALPRSRVGAVLGLPLALAALAWSRRAEASADRAALLAADSLGAVCLALATVGSGVRPTALADLRGQLAQQRTTRTGGLEEVLNLLGTHPLLWTRLRAVAGYACSSGYSTLVGPALAESARWEASELGFVTDRDPAGR